MSRGGKPLDSYTSWAACKLRAQQKEEALLYRLNHVFFQMGRRNIGGWLEDFAITNHYNVKVWDQESLKQWVPWPMLRRLLCLKTSMVYLLSLDFMPLWWWSQEMRAGLGSWPNSLLTVAVWPMASNAHLWGLSPRGQGDLSALMLLLVVTLILLQCEQT